LALPTVGGCRYLTLGDEARRPIAIGRSLPSPHCRGALFTQNSALVSSTPYTTANLEVVALPNAVRALVYVWKNEGSGLAYVVNLASLGVARSEVASSRNLVADVGRPTSTHFHLLVAPPIRVCTTPCNRRDLRATARRLAGVASSVALCNAGPQGGTDLHRCP
jgi:hypothetical protein